jgi:hypothetical protein
MLLALSLLSCWWVLAMEQPPDASLNAFRDAMHAVHDVWPGPTEDVGESGAGTSIEEQTFWQVWNPQRNALEPFAQQTADV